MSGDTVSSERIDTMLGEITRLRVLETEYRVTLKVLAVAVEQLLEATGGEHLVISDGALFDTPDLVAWRNPELCQVVVTVAR